MLAPLLAIVWLALAWSQGGYDATAWGPIGLFLVLLLVTAILASPPPSISLRTPRGLALAFLGAFVTWNFLSITWADFPGEAWVGADKTLIYAATFATCALWPWPKRALVVLLALFAALVAALGAYSLLRATVSDRPESFFLEGRPVPPIGYINGNVGLWMMAVWPAVFLGSTRALPALPRGFFLACAALLLDLAVLGQSRAWLVLLAPMAALAVLLSRQRLRTLLALAVVAATTFTAWDPLLAVFEQSNAGNPIGPPLDDAVRAVGLSVLLAAAAGIAWGLVDARIVLPGRLHRALAMSAGVGAGLALLVVGIVVRSEIDHPREWLSTRWSEFKECCGPDVERSRFEGSLSSDRYQEWKIAWEEFVAHPLTGIGADNYQAAFYLRRGDSDHHPRYPHSLPLRLLSQLGILGSALIAGFVACALWCGLRRRRLSDEIAGGAVAAAIAVCAYWVLHGSVDWFWEIPALSAPAFGFLGLAASPVPAPAGVTPPPVRRRVTYWATAAAVVSAVSLALPWLSQSYENAGAAGWRRDAKQAYARFERAAELNPLSAQPLLVKGSVALQRRDLLVARDALTRAEKREPKNWYIHFQFALADAVAGRRDSARLHIVRAAELNPLDPVVATARRQILRGGTPNPEQLNGRFVAELNRRFGLNIEDPTR